MPRPQIFVLDAGGQYCHLIARKVRDLGVYAEVRPSDVSAAELTGARGIIISGGPNSVYEAGSPRIDPAVLQQPAAVLGICYGQQVMTHELGGRVRKGERGEYGMAVLESVQPHTLLAGVESGAQVWMNHRDQVEAPPPGFSILASTSTCRIAAIAHSELPLMAVQFHPEVAHTPQGSRILKNFVFDLCGCTRDWNPKDRISPVVREIQAAAGDRSIFFFVSGGVDSTVAYKLCLRALPPERVYGIYVDTGLMRDGETAYVAALFERLGATAFHVERAETEFLEALAGVYAPEPKRHVIGEQFVRIQARILGSGRFLDGNWILGQGTIYPDTIESGGTANADLIKTHHNRVAGIQKLIDAGQIVEPLSSFYKDEVREIGRELGVPDEFLHRHPFPGPGLAIRCLCSETGASLEPRPEGWLLPILSVGVQGDARSYRPVLLVDEPPSEEAILRAVNLTNRLTDCNRVIARVAAKVPLNRMAATRSSLDAERLGRLRAADSIVRQECAASGFEREVWQFPVVLIPIGDSSAPDSVVLRPVDSVDGMTARAVLMPPDLLQRIGDRLLGIGGVCGVFYDLTHKPPGTIEWE